MDSLLTTTFSYRGENAALSYFKLVLPPWGTLHLTGLHLLWNSRSPSEVLYPTYTPSRQTLEKRTSAARHASHCLSCYFTLSFKDSTLSSIKYSFNTLQPGTVIYPDIFIKSVNDFNPVDILCRSRQYLERFLDTVVWNNNLSLPLLIWLVKFNGANQNL